MSNFPVVDLVVGMIFIYFLLSVISSSAVEMLLAGFKIRSKMLEEWLKTIFDKDIQIAHTTKDAAGNETTQTKTITLGQAIMDHCAITALSKTGKAPSYIDAKNFASALIEKITYNPNDKFSVATDIDSLITCIENTTMLPQDIQRVLLTYAHEAKNTYAGLSSKVVSELDLFRQKLETWFDSSMDRVSGALKTRWARPFTFTVAFIITISLNADSISIAKYLYNNPEVRAKVAGEAYAATKDTAFIATVNHLKLPKDTTGNDTAATLKQVKDALNEQYTALKKANGTLQDAIPLGWNSSTMASADHTAKGIFFLWLSKIVGLMGTMLAIVMGAPFWFELLNKIANLRSAGNKPATSGGGTAGDAK